MKKPLFHTYSKNNLFRLFLMSAFPVHLWSIFMVLQDVGWIAERSIVIDAFSYAAYSLLFALVESLVVFIAVLLLSLLGSIHWQGKTLVGAMTCLYFAVALWKMAMQVYYYFSEKITYLDRVIVNKLTFGDPLLTQWVIMIVLLLLILTTVVLPVYLLDHNKRFAVGIDEMVNRL